MLSFKKSITAASLLIFTALVGCLAPTSNDNIGKTLQSDTATAPAEYTFTATEYTPAMLVRLGPSDYTLLKFDTLRDYRVYRADHTGQLDIVWVSLTGSR